MAQQYYTVPSTAVYRTADGKRVQKFYQNDQIPMELAIEFGMSGAALTEPDFFSSEEEAAVHALTRPKRGETIRYGQGMSNSTGSANVAYLAEVEACNLPASVTELSALVGAIPTGGNIDLGIYTANAARTTWTRLGSTGALVAAVGMNTGAITAVDTTVDRPYYLAFATDKADITFAKTSMFGAIGAEDNRLVTFAAAYPLPASLSTPSTTGVTVYVLAK